MTSRLMTAATPDPAELDFVLSPDTSGIEVQRRDGYDLHLGPADALLPVVVFVHGPARGARTRPRDWPVYRGYASLAANAGVSGAVLDLDYTDVHALDRPTAQLGELLDRVRAEASTDPNRVAIWAFSGGARLVGRWLEDPPPWLKVVALTYPVVPALTHAATPVVLTRVGLENPEIQATVDRLLEVVPPAELINVSHGRHGFDMLDHDDDSKRAVHAALKAVLRLLV
jgi:acetyl esterase/lipase